MVSVIGYRFSLKTMLPEVAPYRSRRTAENGV